MSQTQQRTGNSPVRETLLNIYTAPKIWVVLVLSTLLATLVPGYWYGVAVMLLYTVPMSYLVIKSEELVVDR